MAATATAARSLFRRLLRAREAAFQGDKPLLDGARLRIREEFIKHRSERDPAKIEELHALGEDAVYTLRRKVIQAEERAPGHFHLNIRKETELADNHRTPKPGECANVKNK